MFTQRIALFRLYGFRVWLDKSWFLLALLITWTLAVGNFPFLYSGLSQSTYWLMGAFGTAGLFLSIVLHEFAHSLVARSYGVPIRGITLFVFGGIAEVAEESPNPKAEMLMALAGPALSVFLSFFFYASYTASSRWNWPVPIKGILQYLSSLNLMLAIFNMVPAFPLDGGRVLRAILWRRKNLRWATRVTASIGNGFALGLMFLGIYSVLRGNFIGGIWSMLIGLFLQDAARSSYRQVLMKDTLSGEPVRRLMIENPISVLPRTTLRDFVDYYVYRHYFKNFPVTQNDEIVGIIDLKKVRQLPQDQWSTTTVQEVMQPVSAENTINIGADAMQALALMNRTGQSRLAVIDGRRLVGVVTLKDLIRFFALKTDLNAEDEERQRAA